MFKSNFMNCKKCGTENEAMASVCVNCGSDLQGQHQECCGNTKYSDSVIIGIGIFLMFSKLFWMVFSKMSSEAWEKLQYISNFFGLIWAAIPLLLAFVVKNKVWKIILIVSGGLYALLSLIDVYRELTHSFVHFNF